MGRIFLRGHHCFDFKNYLVSRDRGKTHRIILGECIESHKITGRERLESFEEYTNNIFRKLYEGVTQNIVLFVGLDGICLGPFKNPPGEWCSGYELGECEGIYLFQEDARMIENLGFERDVPITTSCFVEKVRQIPLPELIYFSKSELVKMEYDKLFSKQNYSTVELIK